MCGICCQNRAVTFSRVLHDVLGLGPGEYLIFNVLVLMYLHDLRARAGSLVW